MILQIGDKLFECEYTPLFDKIRKYFYVSEGKWVLDVSKLNDDTPFIVRILSKIVGFDVGVAVEEAKLRIKHRESQKLKNKLITLLRAGVFAVGVKRSILFGSDGLFKIRGNIAYLDEYKLYHVISKKKLDERTLVDYIVRYLDNCGFEYYPEHVAWLKDHANHIIKKAKLKEDAEKLVLLKEGDGFVEVVFPRELSDEEEFLFRKDFSLVYYVQDKAGNLVPRRLVLFKKKSSTCYLIPFFSVGNFIRIANKLGFNVVDRIQWCRKRIPKPTAKFNLYSFQHEALRNWIKAGCRGVVVIPTGGGKTFVGLSAISVLSVPTLICVTTIELARQWLQKIEEHLGVRAGLLGGGKRDIRDITVAIYNSAVKYIDLLKDRFDLFIADEVHHIPAQCFKEIAFKLKARKRLGLSATPKRFDKNETLIFFSMGDVVYKARYLDLVKLNIVAPLKFYRVFVRLNEKEMEEYLKIKGDSRGSVLKKMKIALSASAKYGVLKKLVEKFENDKIIVFCQYIEQARKAFRAVTEVARGQAVLLTGKTKADLRKKYFELFKEGKKRIIVTTTVLDEGIDVPDAEVAIILSGTGSERQLIQRIGRVIRYRPNKVAKVVEVITKGTIEETLSNRRISVLKDYGFKI